MIEGPVLGLVWTAKDWLPVLVLCSPGPGPFPESSLQDQTRLVRAGPGLVPIYMLVYTSDYNI